MHWVLPAARTQRSAPKGDKTAAHRVTGVCNGAHTLTAQRAQQLTQRLLVSNQDGTSTRQHHPNTPELTLLLVAPAAEAHALLHALRQGAGAAALGARPAGAGARPAHVRVGAAHAASHVIVGHASVGTAHAHAGASVAAHGVHHARLASLVVPADALQVTNARDVVTAAKM